LRGGPNCDTCNPGLMKSLHSIRAGIRGRSALAIALVWYLLLFRDRTRSAYAQDESSSPRP
jgi:hypothetical protein